jgi:hypothetical protein
MTAPAQLVITGRVTTRVVAGRTKRSPWHGEHSADIPTCECGYDCYPDTSFRKVGGEWSASGPGWVDLRAGLDSNEKVGLPPPGVER